MVVIVISSSSLKVVPSFGEVIETDGLKLPVAETITNTSSESE